MHRLALFGALAVLVGARMLFVHGDPSDFPQDRNIALAMQIRESLQQGQIVQVKVDAHVGVSKPTDLTPEFPFMRFVGWLAGASGADPIVACRLFAVLMSLAAGIGIYILGRRLGCAVGMVALWFFALAPLSVLIGRSLLPDPIMIATLTWALVASGAGLSEPRRGAAFWLVFWLAIACLAKLPVIIFVPVIAVGYLSAAQWKRSAWLKLVIGLIAVYLIVCLWYGLAWYWPFPGLQRLSSGTNNLMTATDVAFSAQGLGLAANRLILTLTWPGAALALIGWAWLQSRPGQRAWLNTLVIVSVFFVVLTIGANTYWAAVALPAGCILAAIAAVEIGRLGRWTLAPLAAVSIAILWIDPGIGRIGQNLVTQPALNELRAAARALGDRGPSVFYGRDLNDVAYFTGVPGTTLRESPDDLHPSNTLEKFRYFYSNRMNAAEPVAEQLFALKPVMDTRAGDYIVFKTDRSARLGTPATDPTSGTLDKPIDFGPLRLIALSAAQSEAGPGDRIALDAVFTRNGPESAPWISIQFVHGASGEAFPLPPRSGGALFGQWGLPRIQTPDFHSSEPLRLRYEFELPPLIPAGAYAIRLGQDQEKTADIPLALNVRPAAARIAPAPISLANAVWRQPTRIGKPAWLGQEDYTWALQGDGCVWFNPHLPAGKYRLAIRGRGDYLGADPKTRWPILEVHQPGRPLNQKIEFNSPLARTHTIDIDVRGPDDFIRLRVANPLIDYSVGRPFPLYPHELSGGSKMIELLGIEFLEKK